MDDSIHHRLAGLLPDIPRWVEVRSMLLSGRSRLFGVEAEPTPRFVVCDRERKLIAVVGRASGGAIAEAVSIVGQKGVAICPFEDSDDVSRSLPGWTQSPAALHLLGDETPLGQVSTDAVRFLAPHEIPALDHVTTELKEELTTVAPECLIAATFVDGLAVSFCYVAWETETLWDVSIDTLAEYRGRGYAVLAIAFVTQHMRRKGRQPVWGAEESNTASMGLAKKLGFVVVDRLTVFHAPGA